MDPMEAALERALERAREGRRLAGEAAWPEAAEALALGAAEAHEAAQSAVGEVRQRRLATAVELAAEARLLAVEHGRADEPAAPERARHDDGEGLTAFAPEPASPIRFRDVVGLEDAKRAIDLAIVRPLAFPDEARRLGIRPGGGLLLYGPPGTGKTLLARAVAGEVEAPFYRVSASDILSQWVGQAERNVAKLFRTLRGHRRAVLFLDELEALAPSRGHNRSTVMARVVPQILAELSGFDGPREGLLLIGATNRPQDIDDAILRPGRLDHRVYVGLPGLAERETLFERHLAGRDLSPDLDGYSLATASEGYSGADIAGICEAAARRAFESATATGDPARKLGMEDLRAELAQAVPSVSQRMLRAYEAFGGCSAWRRAPA